MGHYFNQWKFAHPYIEDFRTSIIQYTHVDLNWFFDEWMETTKVIDYAVKGVKKGRGKDEYEITFKRKGMQMPLDFSVVDKKDSTFNYHIPNSWFVKKTDAQVLPRWIGWDKVKPTYTATVKIPEGIEDVLIDPSLRLADAYMVNNAKRIPIKFRFDSKIYNPADWTKYEMFIRPDFWYNGYDGLKVGLNLNGHYMNYKHVFDATIWFNSSVGKNYLDTLTENHMKNSNDLVSYRINYRTATDRFMKGSSVYLSAKNLDGLQGYTIGFDRKDVSGKNKLYMFFKSMYRENFTDLPYLLLPKEWEPNKLNNTINVGLEHSYSYRKGTGTINLGTRTSALMSDYDYQAINITVINRTNIWKLKLNTRIYGQFGTGSNWASESSLFLAGGNPEEMMENKYTRSQGIFNPEWASFGSTTNYFNYGGGLNLRGYSGYLAPELLADGTTVTAYKGQTGAAINGELEFDGIIKIKKQNWLTKTFKLTTYLFGDAGFINYNTPDIKVVKMGGLRADAGIGTALTIKKFAFLQTVNPLTIRFDMPFWLNKIPSIDKDFLQFRFVIGVSRAF